MELVHVVVVDPGDGLRDEPHRVLQGHGEVPPEPVGLEAAGLHHVVGLQEGVRDIETVSPVEPLSTDLDPAVRPHLVQGDHIEAQLLSEPVDPPVLHDRPGDPHSAPLGQDQPSHPRAIEGAHDPPESVHMGGCGERVVIVVVCLQGHSLARVLGHVELP